MATYHEKIVEQKDAMIQKQSEENAQAQADYLNIVQEKDREINEYKAELAKIKQHLKTEENKIVKADEENKDLKKKLKEAEVRSTIKETFMTNFQKLKERKENVTLKLKNLEDAVVGHEYKRITFGEEVHKKMDSIYECMKLPVKPIQFRENEPEREFKVYVQLFEKVQNLERHLKQKRFWVRFVFSSSEWAMFCNCMSRCKCLHDVQYCKWNKHTV